MQEITKNYLWYRRLCRTKGWKHLSFDAWQVEVEAEEEQDARDWERHIRSMSHSSRYV